MSYAKEDFLLMDMPGGGEVLINIPKVLFVIQEPMSKNSRVFFGNGERDYITVKSTIDDFVELL